MSKRIGNLLLEAGVVTQPQLKAAVGRQRRFGGRLATNCLAMGYADERTLSRVLSLQLGVPFVVITRSALPLNLIDEFPLDIARKLNALPVHKAERELFVAMADPTNIATLDELRFVTGATIVEHGALSGILHDAIEEAYRLKEYGNVQFFTGVEFDPSTNLKDTGHVEIVVGSEIVRKDSLPPPAPVFDPAVDKDTGWLDELVREPVIPAAEPPKDKPVILLVEDDSELRRMLKLFLDKAGFDVREAQDGTEAVRSLQNSLPDAMVLDAMLPGVHGFDICFRVKHAEGTRHVPVVMISAVYRGWRYADDVRRLYGADAFLEKPLRLDELQHVLDKLLAESSSAAPTDELSARALRSLEEAVAAYRRGEVFESARHLESAVDAAPFSANLHHRLGMLYDQLDEPYRAIAEMSRAVELEPTYQTLLSIARLYEKTGFTHKAFEAWERCLRLCESEEEVEKIRRHMERLLA